MRMHLQSFASDINLSLPIYSFQDDTLDMAPVSSDEALIWVETAFGRNARVHLPQWRPVDPSSKARGPRIEATYLVNPDDASSEMVLR